MESERPRSKEEERANSKLGKQIVGNTNSLSTIYTKGKKKLTARLVIG